MSKPKLPLKCVVKGGAIVITVGADTLKFATENHPEFWDADTDTFALKVSNKRLWLKSVAYRLNNEEEDGSTALTKLFDEAIVDAVNQGEEGLEDSP